MRIQLRLAHLLGLDRARHIPLSKLARAIGVTRHQLMHLLDNSSPQINRKTLEAVCEYLVGHGRVTPANMFQRVFGVEPDSFWPMLASRQRIDFFLGVRWLKHLGWDQQVMAADAVLQSVLVNRLTGVAAENRSRQARFYRHAQQVINSELALSWGCHGTSNSEVQAESKGFFRQFRREHDDKAIVCIGSIKSNPVAETVIAHGQREAKAFESQDNVDAVQQRSCPFVMIYREEDPHPPSCWAGLKLFKDDKKAKPGIYFEREPGQWEWAPWGPLDDVAIVYYRYQKVPQNLEMVLGGYSGRSTRCLAELLRAGSADQFWPPAIDTDKQSVGAFLVKFQFRRRKKGESVRVRSHQRRIDQQFVKLAADVLAPRVTKPLD